MVLVPYADNVAPDQLACLMHMLIWNYAVRILLDFPFNRPTHNINKGHWCFKIVLMTVNKTYWHHFHFVIKCIAWDEKWDWSWKLNFILFSLNTISSKLLVEIQKWDSSFEIDFMFFELNFTKIVAAMKKRLELRQWS